MNSNDSANGDVTDLPLAGVRVVDFSWIVAGPQGTRILADMGADVVRVEYAGRLDSERLAAPQIEGQPFSPNRAGKWNDLNRNKRSVTLNMNDAVGLATIRQLLAVSDLVVENFSAGVLESKGLSWEEMSAINPALIYISISGYGHTGRDRSYVTWGPTAQAVSGLTVMSGLPGERPAGWGYSFLDHTAGHYCALAAMIALYHRALTGRGQHIDMAQIETGMILAGPAILDRSVNGRSYLQPGNPPGNHARYPAMAPHNTYPCKGADRWLTIAVENEAQWTALVERMGSPAWALAAEYSSLSGRLAHQDALDAQIAAWTAGWDPFELMLWLQAAGVPAGVVQTAEDLLEHDPQLRHRGFYPELDHPELGRHRFQAMPVHASGPLWRLRHAGPLLGADNEDVLCDLLGLDGEQMLERTLEAAAV